MQPRGASKNKDDQAIFSNAGPYLSKPEETNKPSVIPKIYKLKKRKKRGIPKFNIDIPKSGDVRIIAGTKPIKVLIKAVKIREIIISLIRNGAMNRFVKFLLQISSRKSILKLILDLKRKS